MVIARGGRMVSSRKSTGKTQGNGKKPRVLILSDNAQINQLLERRFQISGHPVTLIDDINALVSDSLKVDEDSIAQHDVFLICKPPNGEPHTTIRFQKFLSDLMYHKAHKDRPHLTVTPEERPDGFRFMVQERITGHEGFDAAMNIIQRVFATYEQSQAGMPIDLTLDVADSIDDLILEKTPREEQRMSLPVLEHEIKAARDDTTRVIELRQALGKHYESLKQPLAALNTYVTSLKNRPEDNPALRSLGELLLNQNLTQAVKESSPAQLREILSLFEQSGQVSPDIDHYKNAIYLAIGDEESLRKAIAVSKIHEGTVHFGYFYPAMIDAYTTLVHRLKRPEDIAELYDLIETLVSAVRGEDYMTDAEATVGIRLVKKHTGRHTVYDIVPTTRQGSIQSQHVFVKAFTPRQRRSARTELENIIALNERNSQGTIRTSYAELDIPPFAVIVEKPADSNKQVYLITPLLEGQRADHYLRALDDPVQKEAYLKEIMDAGIALQIELREAGRVFEPSPDFYVNRFEAKVLERFADIHPSIDEPITTVEERKEAISFIRNEINNKLIDVGSGLKLPYTGSHTLKNILIDTKEGGSLTDRVATEEETAQLQKLLFPQELASTPHSIKRCDLEDASNRFFVSDHVLSIEDSAIGIHDKDHLKRLYDRLLLRMLAAQNPEMVDDELFDIDTFTPQKRTAQVERLLKQSNADLDRKNYHDLVARTSFERHLTFAFDRIKEMYIKAQQLGHLESKNEHLRDYGAYIRQLQSMTNQTGLNYDKVLDNLLDVRDRHHPEQWRTTFLYFSLRKDYEIFRQSKDLHLRRVEDRMHELWETEKKFKRASGYKALKKIIAAAKEYK